MKIQTAPYFLMNSVNLVLRFLSFYWFTKYKNKTSDSYKNLLTIHDSIRLTIKNQSISFSFQ